MSLFGRYYKTNYANVHIFPFNDQLAGVPKDIFLRGSAFCRHVGAATFRQPAVNVAKTKLIKFQVITKKSHHVQVLSYMFET